jgi:hypothetical protein
MSSAFQKGDGKTCLDAFDKMKGMPEYDPSTYAMIRGDCLMQAGRCDEGRKVVRDYYNQPKANVMLQMTQQQIDSSVSSIALMYCPPSQLSASERAQRTQILLSRAGNDKTQAAHYADEMAAILPQLPRGTQEERQKIIGYEYQIGKAYGDAGRCNEARAHFHAECSLSSPQYADNCTNGLLNNTSGCKSSP